MFSLKDLAIKGAIWNVGGGVAQTFIRLGASMILARVLDPFDFGIMGMGMMVISFLTLLANAGIGAGIIAKRSYNQADLSTAFWFMLFFRILLFLVAFFSAPFFADFFHEARLTNALRVMSFAFLLSAISTVSYSLLSKDLRFSIQNLIQVLSILLESSMAVLLAVKFNLHYWSLVIAMLIACFFSQVTFFVVARWRPTFEFSMDSFRYYKKYIINGIGSSLMVYFLGHADYLIVGRILGTANLGFYEFSYRIPHLVRWRFSQPLSNVLFPVLARSDNISRSLYGLYTTIKINAIVSSVILIFLAVFSKEVILFLWGHKWLRITTILTIASIGALIECIISTRNSVFLAFQRPDLNFKSNFLHASLTVIFLLLLIPKFGLEGAALAVVLGLIVPIFYFIYSIRLVKGDLLDLLFFFLLLFSGILIIAAFLKLVVFSFLQSFNFFIAFIFICILYLFLVFLFIYMLFHSFVKEILVLLRETFKQ